jgi:hypothetical protein
MVAAADGKPPLVGGLKRFCCSERGQRLEQNKDRANRFKKKWKDIANRLRSPVFTGGISRHSKLQILLIYRNLKF